MQYKKQRSIEHFETVKRLLLHIKVNGGTTNEASHPRRAIEVALWPQMIPARAIHVDGLVFMNNTSKHGG